MKINLTKYGLEDCMQKPNKRIEKVEEKREHIKEEKFKEEVKEIPLFSSQSYIAQENMGNVNCAEYLYPTFQRFIETDKDEMHLSKQHSTKSKLNNI